jgi:Ca2+-binding EF-hand superfamily protein
MLFEEFSKIDLNQDGAVSLEEIIAFLQSKVVSGITEQC